MKVLVLVLHGAYGRDYTTWEACKQDWEAGKDFKIFSGPYCSIRDAGPMKSQGVRKLCFMRAVNSEFLGEIAL